MFYCVIITCIYHICKKEKQMWLYINKPKGGFNLAGINKDYLKDHRTFRLRNKRIIAIFPIVSVLIIVAVFLHLMLVGVTVTSDALCGIEEHIHTEECYSGSELICAKPEHTHSSDCFPDNTADTETYVDWMKTFENVEMTDNVSGNLASIATTQVGYAESNENYNFDAQGIKKGYTRYGEWFGNPYGNWNTMFVSFCIHYAGIENSDALTSANALTMQQKWQTYGVYETAANHIVARNGEIVFLDTDGDSLTDSAGILVLNYADNESFDEDMSKSEEKIGVILGDSNDKVEFVPLNIDEVTGFGLTHNLQSDNSSSVQKSESDTNDVFISELDSYGKEKSAYYSQLSSEIKSDIDKLGEEEQTLLVDLLFSINQLPDTDEFFNTLDEFYNNDDTQGEESYITSTQERMTSAYAHYQEIDYLREYIFNLDKLFELKDVFSSFSVQMFTTGTSSPVTFNFFNRGWNAVAPILIYGGSAREVITTGSKPNVYWHGIVVDYNSDEDYYYVSKKYEGGTSSDSSSVLDLKPSTSKGFVLFIWMADTSSTTVQMNAATTASAVEVGDRVTISVDPSTLSAGYKSSGYGTITFSEYIPPATETEEDLNLYEDSPDASDSQIVDGGGKVTSADQKVITTKTINGTSEENVFDITLTVQTQADIQTFLSEPDMAVVIVMDISNTMNSYYPNTQKTTTRYDAAVAAAENFMRQFAAETAGLSQIGFVAFNTHAHEILPLQPCTTSNVDSLISVMKTDTKAIISASGYANSHDRFTNVEGGLKRGYDMIKNSGNANKYVVFLSDGFPTTYLKDNSDDSTNYNGYDPYTSSGTVGADGVFHDDVLGVYCGSGTSYSDKASIKARVMADRIKSSGTKIFSIGVDVGGQKVQTYVDAAWSTGSVVDRTSTTYEIGSPTSTSAYTNWLGNSIGSGYYYDSTNSEELENAFTEIFAEIREINEQSTKTIWTVSDPMPVHYTEPGIVGFIHFFDKDGNPVASPDNPEKITGTHTVNGENSAHHSEDVIYWDLKKSGYTTSQDSDNPSVTYYYYSLKYRIRLVNEKNDETEPFVENHVYQTNGDAKLEYRLIVETNGVQQVSPVKYVSFSKPSVLGYLGEFEFIKQGNSNVALPGAEFTLTHDDENCTACHGDNTAITDSDAHEENYTDDHFIHVIGPYKAVSDSGGKVSFTNIPSGHSYILTESVPPEGYVATQNKYNVTVAYDETTVTQTNPDGTVVVWTGDNNVITNVETSFIFPETGANGTTIFYIVGSIFMLASVVLILKKRMFSVSVRKFFSKM